MWGVDLSIKFGLAVERVKSSLARRGGGPPMGFLDSKEDSVCGVLTLGVGQTIRGANWGSQRPRRLTRPFPMGEARGAPLHSRRVSECVSV